MHSDVRAPLSLKAAALFALAFLHFPIVVIVLYAFTTEEIAFTFPPPGLTTHWFDRILERSDFWQALEVSLQIAAIATLLAIILGTMIALATYRRAFFGRDMISLVVILPIALPGIVSGIALRSSFVLLGVDFTIWTIIVSHATFCIVTVYNNVVARLRRMSGSLVEASMDLGATHLQTFRYIVLPNIASALLAGGMLAFALSFDEIIVTTFTAGTKDTLPIWIMNQLLRRPNERPITNVGAIVVVLITLGPIYLAYRLTQNTRE